MERTNGTTSQKSPSYSELQEKLQVLETLTGTLTGRIQLAGRMGFSHGGDRDLYKTLGYPTHVSSSDMISRWKRQDIARAIVDRPVQATWRGDVSVSESTEENETALEKEYKALDQELGLKRMFMRADRLAQLGKYSVILLGYDDSAQETWSQPVTEGERELRYLRVVSEKNAEISTWEQDNSSPRYGLPRIYNIKLKHPGEKEKQASLKVHYSRIIHIAPDLLENEVEAEPILETAYNRLMDLEKLVGGSAEMFWRGARPGYAANAKEDYKIDDDLKKKMQTQIEEYENDLRRIMVMEGLDLSSLAQQIADPKGHIDAQIQMLSALTGIPSRILVGSEQSQLASGQDSGHWKEWVHDRRTEMAEPVIIRPFVDRMIETGVLPEVQSEDEGYQISWPDLFTLNEKESAEVGTQRASALGTYVKEGAEMTVPLEAFLRYMMKLDEDDVNHILELRDGQLEEIMEEENELEQDLDAGIDAPPEVEPEPES